MTTLITAAPQGRSRRSIAHCPEPRIRPRTSAPDQGWSRQAIRLLPLDDALVICLAVLDETPDSFQQAAAVWHARWCTFSPSLTLADAHVALDALQALPGPAPVEGARSLRALSERHGHDEVIAVLDEWLLGGTGSAALANASWRDRR